MTPRPTCPKCGGRLYPSILVVGATVCGKCPWSSYGGDLRGRALVVKKWRSGAAS